MRICIIAKYSRYKYTLRAREPIAIYILLLDCMVTNIPIYSTAHYG